MTEVLSAEKAKKATNNRDTDRLKALRNADEALYKLWLKSEIGSPEMEAINDLQKQFIHPAIEQVQPSSTVQGGEPDEPVNIRGRLFHKDRLTPWQEGREVVEPKPADGWISVKDRLPNPGENVLAILCGYEHHSQHYTVYRTEPLTGNEFWTWRDSHTGRQELWFTHWQPLPAPPLEATL